MKKRVRKSKTTIKTKNEIIGVLVFAIGVFSGLSIYFTKYSGFVGLGFKKILSGVFGLAAFIIPFIIMIAGILIICLYYFKINRRKIITFLSTILIFMSIIHLLYFSNYDNTDFMSYVKSSFNAGMEYHGTGIFSAVVTYATYSLFGLPGSYVFLISLFTIALLIVTNLSLKQLGRSVYNLIVSDRPKKKDEVFKTSKAKKSFVGEVINLEKEEVSNDYKHRHDDFTDAHTDDNEEKIKIINLDNSEDFLNHNAPVEAETQRDKETSEDTAEDLNIKITQLTIPYMVPPISILKYPKKKKSNIIQEKQFLDNAKLLEETLDSFGVSAKVLQISKGPVITRYELQPARGVKVSSIVKLADDIALNMAAQGVRIEAPIPGKAAVGIEIPNKDIAPVLLREVIETESFQNHPSKIAFALGKDIAGNNIIADIAKMPHLLIAGATGSGKSVCINSLIISILYKATPDEVKLIMIDPKVVELSNYNGIPHLMIPVVTDPKKAAGALNWVVQEMVTRYKTFAEKGVRDFERYNELIAETDTDQKLPQIVVIIDELADLMMIAPGDVEDSICRLAQMARAAGIHLVIATQRPSVDVITGVIKANIPSRIAFAVSSQVDSRTILDVGGAEKLLGRGDMLYYPVGFSKPIRVQGTYITEKEVEAVVNCIKNQNVAPEYNEDILEEIAVIGDNNSDDNYDELLPDAIELVIDAGQASISMLQRRLRVGYARAARMIDEMEARGIVSGFNGSKTRNVLITREEFNEQFKAN